MNKAPILLMTACIHPDGMPETALQDAKARMAQYLKALEFYLKQTSFKILFVENSGTDISSMVQEAENEDRMEIITYQGNDFDHSLGKGYGECLTLETALKQSKLLKQDSILIKVSGRHIVKNINAIIECSNRLVASERFVVCDINKKTHGANSDMFLASKDFYELLVSNKTFIDESKGVWFEHALYETIEQFCQKGGEFQYLPIPLYQEGQSGSMGIPFRKPSMKMYLMDGVKALLYKLKIKKVC